ncbi:MAG: RagB/SusD family nutrient uptake outer membrane protein [Muribaculaceae bacterium]|nr:RagB/SusD family nutrient uptake outer membrane protein [Muribaculaceae bacterium]
MKKIFLSLLLVGGLLSSCDMDKKPIGSLDDSTAIQSVNDCLRFRNGIYSSMRSLSTGGYVSYPEIQMDMFQGLISNGNRIGNIANGNILSNDVDIESIWAGLYTRINSVNYFLEKVDAVLANPNLDEAGKANINRYIGEAKFARAYYYYWLMDHFCASYTAENADAPAMGLPIVTVYNPTGDRSKYPGRSTQNETYALIEQDLAEAYEALAAYEQIDASACTPNSAYVCTNTINALQARIALLKGEYATAIIEAEEVIGSGAYTLANLDNYINIWTNDTNNEIIFRPFADVNEVSGLSSTGSAWLSIYGDNADYIPSFEALAMYDNGDVRFEAFFNVWNLVINGVGMPAYVFYKYPGNEALKTGSAMNLMNMPKPFRLSEQYLIIAEAAAALGQNDKANDALNELRKNRIAGYTETEYAGQELILQVRDERTKELIGEGFRMSDLRRWGIGFRRSATHPENPAIEDVLVVAGKDVSYAAGDHRFVWPIPSSEMETNPQLEGQQNPGY